MRNAIVTMFGSKKFLTAVTGVAVVVLEDLGLPISEEALLPLVAYIVGQGIADHGKERAKVESGKADELLGVLGHGS
ncbi:MAG: hypothetical protein F4Z33_01730 [Gemmatimonadales bacterium]|nr:hypothetical protein [Gemmatimonadales bacterium]MXX71240.1 hypothetical protein [Gemmatimonadota bacterium]MXX77715.1 hypothetical protein [Gemmatimonadales bacterium]MYC89078.1 hypothetical protein [Candidatus Palauibacter denitrificans]MYG36680.1 hypothetical protein [Gemmatimonadota bacterium]